MTKSEIFNLLMNNKFKLFNVPGIDYQNERLKIFLLENNITLPLQEITKDSVYDYLNDISIEDKTCNYVDCNNVISISNFSKGNRTRKKYCSRNCYYKQRSLDQKGENNTSHRMTDETKRIQRLKLSKSLKKAIKEGKFKPKVTNSWANSKCNIIINNVEINVRSTWEAFFYLVNPHLKYEEIVIQYDINGSIHNYIVDFVDEDNKILYEIKPANILNRNVVKIKEQFAIKWCVDNNYTYKCISNNWFKENYPKYKDIIKGQPSENKMFKNLRQFDED
jgi:hypothetical protein